LETKCKAHRQSLHVIEGLNCSLEAYEYRDRQTVRDFTSRGYGGWINPLTKTNKRVGKTL